MDFWTVQMKAIGSYETPMSGDGPSKRSSATLYISSAKVDDEEEVFEAEKVLTSDESEEDDSISNDEAEAEDQLEELSIVERKTHDGGGLRIRGGKVRRESTNSLPTDQDFKKPTYNVNGRTMHPNGPQKKKPNTKKTTKAPSHFTDFDYESDFESDDDEAVAISNITLTKMRILKKKRDNMRELEKKLTAEEAKRERLKKYRELEIRHSGNSLQITNHRHEGRQGRGRPSPKPSPIRPKKLSMTKSQSHDLNLNKRLSPVDPIRPHSLDRSPATSRKTFSRAPNSVPRKPVRNGRGKSPSKTLPSHYVEPTMSRRSTPGMVLDRTTESRAVSFTKSTNKKLGSYGTNLTPESLASQFRTASESNLLSMGKNNSNLRSPANEFTINDYYNKVKTVETYKDKKNDIRSYGNSSKPPSSYPPIVSHRSLPPTSFRKKPQPSPSISVPSSVSPKESNNYFEIELDQVKLNSKKTLKRPPTLTSSRLVSPAISHRNSVLSSSSTSNPLNESDIETVAYQPTKNYNSIQNKQFKPFPSAKDAYVSTMELLQSSEWEEQVEGIIALGRLATFHTQTIQRDLKEINVLLMKHAKNLRSQVSRAAIQVIIIFFDFMKKAMESDLDKFTSLLLNKISDTNKFLKEDSNNALDMMIEVISPPKAIASIIQEGINHRNPTIKTAVARLLAYSAERLTAAKVLNQRDVAEKMLPAVVKLAQEGSIDVRRYTRVCLQRLATQPQFDASMKKYVSSDELKNIQKVLDNIKNERSGSKSGQETARHKADKGGRFR